MAKTHWLHRLNILLGIYVCADAVFWLLNYMAYLTGLPMLEGLRAAFNDASQSLLPLIVVQTLLAAVGFFYILKRGSAAAFFFATSAATTVPFWIDDIANTSFDDMSTPALLAVFMFLLITIAILHGSGVYRFGEDRVSRFVSELSRILFGRAPAA